MITPLTVERIRNVRALSRIVSVPLATPVVPPGWSEIRPMYVTKPASRGSGLDERPLYVPVVIE